MKTEFLAICAISCLLLETSCNNHMRMDSQSEQPALAAQKDTPIIYCWFVEDNGAGHQGYVFFDAGAGRALLPDERLFSTIEGIRDAIKNRSKTPYLIPQHPDWVPTGWRVRNLSTNEVDRLGFSSASVTQK